MISIIKHNTHICDCMHVFAQFERTLKTIVSCLLICAEAFLGIIIIHGMPAFFHMAFLFMSIDMGCFSFFLSVEPLVTISAWSQYGLMLVSRMTCQNLTLFCLMGNAITGTSSLRWDMIYSHCWFNDGHENSLEKNLISLYANKIWKYVWSIQRYPHELLLPPAGCSRLPLAYACAPPCSLSCRWFCLALF